MNWHEAQPTIDYPRPPPPLQVHDIKGRVAATEALLQAKRFTQISYASTFCRVQTSKQVHDIKGRVAATEALLQAKGFTRVTVYKEPRFADCNLFMVYGARR